VSLANRMTVASPLVSARTIEANEFPALSQRFGVQGVPRTIVNEREGFVGALPEPQFVQSVLQAAGISPNGAEPSQDPEAEP